MSWLRGPTYPSSHSFTEVVPSPIRHFLCWCTKKLVEASTSIRGSTCAHQLRISPPFYTILCTHLWYNIGKEDALSVHAKAALPRRLRNTLLGPSFSVGLHKAVCTPWTSWTDVPAFLLLNASATLFSILPLIFRLWKSKLTLAHLSM